MQRKMAQPFEANIKKDKWSEEEDKILIQAHSEIGNKWAEISKRLPCRTENSIKNHWNATKHRQFTCRRCRSSKYLKSGYLLQNYIKSLSSTSQSTAITESQKGLIENKSNGFISGPNEKVCHVMTTSATDVDHHLLPPCEYFNGMPNLLLDVDDHGYMFDPIGCQLESTPANKGFEMEPFERVDLVEMISNNSK